MKLKTFIGLFVAILVPVAFFLYFDGNGIPKRPKLKRYIPLLTDTIQPNKVKINDTLWHTIPQFEFTAHTGKKVTEQILQNKITVVDFFFTKCPSICPKMSSQLQRVQQLYKDDKQIQILSHTVDPENDNVQTLANYADIYEADSSKWLFLTAPKADIYKQAREGYFVTASQGDGGKDDFIHTEKFILIDSKGVIRGYYDGTDKIDVDRLIGEIVVLKMEFPSPKKELELRRKP